MCASLPWILVSYFVQNSFPSVKRLLDSLIAVRETGVSRHQGGPIEGPPETPRTSQHYHIEGINNMRANVNIVFSVLELEQVRLVRFQN